MATGETGFDLLSFAWVDADFAVDLIVGRASFLESGIGTEECAGGGWWSTVEIDWTRIEDPRVGQEQRHALGRQPPPPARGRRRR